MKMEGPSRQQRSSYNASKKSSPKWGILPLYIFGMALALSLILDAVDAGHFYTVNRQKALQRFGKRWSISPEEERNIAELRNILQNSRRKKSFEIETDTTNESQEDDPAAIKREWPSDEDSANDMVQYEPIVKRAAYRSIPGFWAGGDAARFEGEEDGDF